MLSRSTKQSFPTFWWHIYSNQVFLKYAKSYSKVIALYVGLGRLKRCCIYRHRYFEHSLVKPSIVYVVIIIGVTDVKDCTSNNITWDLSLRLRTHPTQNNYKKIVVLKLMFLLIQANLGQSIERRIFISRPVETTDLDKYAKMTALLI